MDNLFSPEVIQQILELLKTATDGGVKAVIIWMILPLLSTIIVTTSTCYVILKVVRYLRDIHAKSKSSEIEAAKIEAEKENLPVEYKLAGLSLTSQEAELLNLYIVDFFRSKDTNYIRTPDIRELGACIKIGAEYKKDLSSLDLSRLVKLLTEATGSVSSTSITALQVERIINERTEVTK